MEDEEYEIEDGKRMIYRGYSDLETYQTITHMTCPYCQAHTSQIDADDCGKTYEIECDECKNEFLMHFDAD